MAVELMPGYNFTAKMEVSAAQEAAAAGLQSVEKLMRLLSHSTHQQNFQEQPSTKHQAADQVAASDYQAVADAAVYKFKKFISLLDRSPRTGHARFRRGPVPCSPPLQQKTEPAGPSTQTPKTEENASGSRIYCPTPIQRLPPLPLPHLHQQLVKNASIERKEASTTINFASPAASFISSLTGDTDSLQPSMSSGFQITNLSQVSSAGRPPLSTSSFKRKCSSMDEANAKCGGGGSSRCHCPKKR